MNTTENNKKIAEFLGWEIQSDPTRPKFGTVKPTQDKDFLDVRYSDEDLKFHNDWNWLMEVVEKIESLGYWIEIHGGTINRCLIGSINSSYESFKVTKNTKIEAVYNACIDFIKWWNENKN